MKEGKRKRKGGPRLPRFEPRSIDREDWDAVLGTVRVPVEREGGDEGEAAE